MQGTHPGLLAESVLWIVVAACFVCCVVFLLLWLQIICRLRSHPSVRRFSFFRDGDDDGSGDVDDDLMMHFCRQSG